MQAQQERWPLPSRHKLIQRHQIRPQENYSCLLGAKLTVRWPAQPNYVKKICELQRKHCPYWEKSRPVVCCDTTQGGGGPDKVWVQTKFELLLPSQSFIKKFAIRLDVKLHKYYPLRLKGVPIASYQCLKAKLDL